MYWLDEKNRQVEEMFSKISPTYDLLNHILSLNIDKIWRKKAVSLLNGEKFLDVATGTGDVLLEISKQNSGAELIGVDLSLKMLKIAKKKIKNGFFICSPAENLPFKDNTFDGVIIAYGLRNVVDRVSALFEFKRVLKRKGKLVILEFNRPTNTLFGSLYTLYSFNIMPFLGKLIAGDSKAYEYLPRSIRKFPDVQFLKGLMERVGFKSVSYYPLTFGVSFIHTGVKP